MSVSDNSKPDFKATHTGRVKRLDIGKYAGTGLEYYNVKLMRLGANWITQGGTVFGSQSGKPKGRRDVQLMVVSVTPIPEPVLNA